VKSVLRGWDGNPNIYDLSGFVRCQRALILAHLDEYVS